MKLTKPPKLDEYQVREGIDNSLELWSMIASPCWGIFYKGRQLILSKARVYYQEGRAKAELFRRFKRFIYYKDNYHHEFNKQDVKKYLNELIENGTIEIKQL